VAKKSRSDKEILILHLTNSELIMSNPNHVKPFTPPDSPDTATTARIREIGMLTRALLEAEDALERERSAHQQTRAEMAQHEMAASNYAEILQSTSWRVTAPMRWVITKLRKP
jgi:hypothetical protein